LDGLKGVYQRIPPLDLKSTTNLVTQTLRRKQIVATAEQISDLSLHMDGYPPSVSLAVSLAHQYGLDTVLSDKSLLSDFKIRTFVPILEKLPLDATDWQILRILAGEPMLPLKGLSAIEGAEDEDTAKRLKKLIDLNLVLPVGPDFEISYPIKAAVFSSHGIITDQEYEMIAKKLRQEFWIGDQNLPRFTIIAATVHALSRSKVEALKEFEGLVLPSTLFKAAKEYYDRGGQEAWEAGLKLAEMVVKLDEKHKKARILLFKILVRLNQWSRADETLTEIKKNHYVEQYYLTGFLQWKRGALRPAVTGFKAAVAINHRSPEVYHGLGHCLFRLGNIPEAKKAVLDGLRSRRPNRMLLHLGAQIAIEIKDYASAEDYVDQLKRLGEDADYYHRYSTLLAARKAFRPALTFADMANKDPRRRFEFLANRVGILIELEEYKKADEELTQLDNNFRLGWDYHDVRLALRCKLLLRQNQWRPVETLLNQLKGENARLKLALRVEILKKKIQDLTASPGERAEAQQELEAIASPEVIADWSNEVVEFEEGDAELEYK
jgi:tetratricopeptide (TPR) repeat protein